MIRPAHQFVEQEPPRWELNGDQYELFARPPGPARMFRSLLGLPDPEPEIVALSGDEFGPSSQYEIFPELGKALQPKPEAPPGMVLDDDLEKVKAAILEEAGGPVVSLEPVAASLPADELMAAAFPPPPPSTGRRGNAHTVDFGTTDAPAPGQSDRG